MGLSDCTYKEHSIHLNNGYPAIYVAGKGTVYIHRDIAAEMLGRDLKPDEVVHHCDQNRSNYDRDNIMVFRTTSDHTAYHIYGVAMLTDDGTYICNEKVRRLVSTSKHSCPVCGKEKSTRAKLCIECHNHYKEEHIQGSDKLKPTKDKLQGLLKTNSKEKIGRMYGVSGKAVAKWAKKYELN